MSRQPKFSAAEKTIEATAAAWLAQQDDHLTPEEAASFARWRSENPHHEAAVQRLEKTWRALHQLRDFRPESQTHPNRDLLARRRKPPIARFPILIAASAIAACLVAAVVWSSSRTSRPTRLAIQSDSAVRSELDEATYVTAGDGYQRATLTDGSVVELNANSEVRVHYIANERRVRLLQGEANFIVAKNKQRPFWVDAGTISVRAVGTAFNVRLGLREVEVLVTEGKVTVKTKPETGSALGNTGPMAPVTMTPAPGDSALTSGQRLIFSVESFAPKVDVQSLPPETIRDALAWQGMRLRFVDTPLTEVAAQFNRQNPVQIEIADASLATLPVDGSFRANNVEAFVRLLESNGNITAERIGTERIILHKSR